MFPRYCRAARMPLPMLFALWMMTVWSTDPRRATATDAQPAPTGGIEGVWQGSITLPTAKLRLVLKVRRDAANGALAGTLDSIDQGARDLPVVNRPQEPARPLPYQELEVSYDSAPGVKLAATLTLPPGKGPFPAVVLITGSGPQDWDESLAGHRPFYVLADYLTRRGVAVLRADDRGTGKSTGNYWEGTTSEDFATDALAGVRFLAARADIRKGQIGLVGHSEGGLIAPLV